VYLSSDDGELTELFFTFPTFRSVYLLMPQCSDVVDFVRNIFVYSPFKLTFSAAYDKNVSLAPKEFE